MAVLRWLVGPALVIAVIMYLARAFDGASTLEALAGIDGLLLFLATLALTLIYWVLRSVRWWLLIRLLNPDHAFAQTYLDTTSALLLAELTPAQGGEAAKVLYATRGQSGQVPEYIGLFGVERVVDTLLLVGLAAITAPFVQIGGLNLDMRLVAGLVVLALALLGILLAFRMIRALVRRFLQPLSRLSLQRGVVLFAISLMGWGVTVWMWQLVFFSAGIELAIPAVVVVMAVTTFAALFSFAPSGVGSGDAVLFLVLTALGVAAPPAIAGVAAMRICSVIVLALGGVHYAARKYRLRARSAGAGQDG